MTDYVMIHGAWRGSWCWKRVRELLTAEGHRVFTPTLTGLGERCHLLSRDGPSFHIAARPPRPKLLTLCSAVARLRNLHNSDVPTAVTDDASGTMIGVSEMKITCHAPPQGTKASGA